jgi:hypothetical protein
VPAVTKPGNSDPDRPDNDAAEPETAGQVMADDAEKAEPDATDDATDDAADATDDDPAGDPADDPAEADSAVDEAESEDEPESEDEDAPEDRFGDRAEDEPEPEIVELEKAPPVADEPVMPTAAEAARERGERPRPRVLAIAFYLAIACAVVGVVSSIDLFINKAELVKSAREIKTTKPLTAAEAERAVTSLLWLYLVVVVALGAFLVLFAYKAQDGVRRSRMMALIITLILLLFHFYFFGTPYGQISGLFAAVTVALMYLPSTREYFGPRQIRR